MYQFVTGPLAWLSFTIFIVGVIVHAVKYARGLDWKMDRVTYGKFRPYGVKGAINSVVSWLIPFGTRSWRVNPGYTVLVFALHIGILLTPFMMGHNVLLQERFGFSLPTIPEGLADRITIVVILAALFLVLRRIALPEARFITTTKDYLLIALTALPFVTGFLSFHQMGDGEFWLIAHILSGELVLVAIPLTKLSHFVLFFCSRIQIGMDYGIKRGGMKEGASRFSW